MYHIYHLITPIYTNNNIKLYSIDNTDKGAYFVRDKLVYEFSDTPDDYALLLTSYEPDTYYDYELIMENGDQEASYQFKYDENGDRPRIEKVGDESISAS